MKRTLTICAALAMVFLASCGKNTESEIESITKDYLQGMQNEDIARVLKNIDDLQKKDTENALKPIFEQYDLDYKIISIKVQNVQDKIAETEVVQEVRKLKGPDAIEDARTTTVFTFRKGKDGWKIVKGDVKETKKL